MAKFLKIAGIEILLIFLLPALIFCEESITITSYYPSPYGVYKNLRIYPNDEETPGDACSNPGEMYFDDSEDTLYICSSGTWKKAPGGTSSTLGESVMYLRAISGTGTLPANCPSGWTPADYKLEAAGPSSNFVRTCYRCN